MKIPGRFPHYRLNNAFDCGPTSLRMIAKHYGADYSAEEFETCWSLLHS